MSGLNNTVKNYSTVIASTFVNAIQNSTDQTYVTQFLKTECTGEDLDGQSDTYDKCVTALSTNKSITDIPSLCKKNIGTCIASDISLNSNMSADISSEQTTDITTYMKNNMYNNLESSVQQNSNQLELSDTVKNKIENVTEEVSNSVSNIVEEITSLSSQSEGVTINGGVTKFITVNQTMNTVGDYIQNDTDINNSLQDLVTEVSTSTTTSSGINTSWFKILMIIVIIIILLLIIFAVILIILKKKK